MNDKLLGLPLCAGNDKCGIDYMVWPDFSTAPSAPLEMTRFEIASA